MRVAPVTGFLTPSEVRAIHGAALRLLSEVGVQVEGGPTRRRLAEAGVRRRTSTASSAPFEGGPADSPHSIPNRDTRNSTFRRSLSKDGQRCFAISRFILAARAGWSSTSR